MKVIKIKNAKNALASIKTFSKKHTIIINKMLNLINEIYEFFKKRYSFLATRVFLYSKNDLSTSNLND